MVQGTGSLTARAPLRVAFTIIPRRSWAGGYNYQSNLFAALNRYRQGEIAPVVFAGEQDDAADLEALARIPGVEIAQSAAFDRRRAGLAAALSLGIDYAAVAEFRERKVDVVFEIGTVFWLASAISGGGLVSGLSASTIAATVFASGSMETRDWLSCANRVGSQHHAQQ